jgi:plastocyanin
MWTRACASVAVAITSLAGCGPSLWSNGGGSRAAAPGFADRDGSGTDDGYPGLGGDGAAAGGGTTRTANGPAGEKAASFHEAADLLAKAQLALDDGNRNLAELLFSTAELLTGPDAVADLADQFRTGAPPRVTEPPTPIADPGPPAETAVGSSDAEDEVDPPAPEPVPVGEAPPPRASLEGTLRIGGSAPGGTLAFVTLEPTDRRWSARKAKQRVMEQRDRQFGPRLMLIPVGSTVSFPNFDRIFHNVFSTSSSAPFDLGLYKQGQTRSVTFAQEGIVRIGCNLHANMAATIVVIGAPHYVFTGEDGGFRFRSLAPGTYRLRGWSEKTREPITQDVTIKPGKNTVTVGVAADGVAGPLPDKFGKARKLEPEK